MRSAILILFFGIGYTQAASFAPDVQPVLKEHCVKCHGEETQKARIRLDRLTEF